MWSLRSCICAGGQLSGTGSGSRLGRKLEGIPAPLMDEVLATLASIFEQIAFLRAFVLLHRRAHVGEPGADMASQQIGKSSINIVERPKSATANIRLLPPAAGFRCGVDCSTRCVYPDDLG